MVSKPQLSRPVIGITLEWYPEFSLCAGDTRLFAAFVAAAAERR
jgi:hypothetical protein